MEGDNRAMAVNTVDDSVVTDLAVSWAIVTASRVEQNNEAWAMASCQRCATRAVAFQVLLMLPTSNVIAPVNAALAYNQDCTSCLTEAIASQLVVTVTDIPTAQAQALVSRAMDRIEALRGSLASYSAIQIYTLLQGAQSEILEVLRADGRLPGTVTPTQEPTPDAALTPTTGPSVVPTPTVEPGSTPEPTPTFEPTPSAEPTAPAEPTPTARARADGRAHARGRPCRAVAERQRGAEPDRRAHGRAGRRGPGRGERHPVSAATSCRAAGPTACPSVRVAPPTSDW